MNKKILYVIDFEGSRFKARKISYFLVIDFLFVIDIKNSNIVITNTIGASSDPGVRSLLYRPTTVISSLIKG